MLIAGVIACLVLVTACGGPGGASTGSPAAGPAGGQPPAETRGSEALHELDLLGKLLVEPFERQVAELYPPEGDAVLGEAVADLFAASTAGQDAQGPVLDVVLALGRPVRAGHGWVDADGRRAVARAELQALLGDGYEPFLADARALWARAEPCRPGCTEDDLWPGGRPLGPAERRVADACAGVPAFAPPPGRHGMEAGARQEGEVDVEARAVPEGFVAVEALPDGRGTQSERGELSPDAATGWHVLLASGALTGDDPHLQVQSVLAPAPEVCHLLRGDARRADRWNPGSAALEVRGRPAVLRVLGDGEQSTLTWREDDDLLLEVHGYGGVPPETVVEVAEGLRVARR